MQEAVVLIILFFILTFNFALKLKKTILLQDSFSMLLSKHANNVQFLMWAKVLNMTLWQKGNYLFKFLKDSAAL